MNKQFRTLNTLCVNPAAKLSVASDEILQFRFPDSRHVSIECDARGVFDLISNTMSVSAAEWAEKICSSRLDISNEVAEHLVSSLAEINVLIPSHQKREFLGDAIFMHEHLSTSSAKLGFELPVFSTVMVDGEGVVADTIREILEKCPDYRKTDSPDADYKIIASDTPRIANIRERYAAIGDAKIKSVMWFDEGSFRIGPLHIKDETACFECFISRSEATAHFFEEARTFNTSEYKSPNECTLGPMEVHLVNFLVERHLKLVQQGQFNIVLPGAIETYDLLSGDSTSMSLQRNPYCKCGSCSSKPSRAVRNMV